MGFFIPALIGAGAALASGSLAGGSRSSGVDGLEVPKWWEDPNYRQTQDFLQPYGEGILNGNIPDYYKPIGETGGSEFEKYLALTNRDISTGATEAMAKSGRARGGALPAVTSQLIADNSTKARYADYERALQGRAGLFDAGRGITEGVRSAGIQNQGQRNQFNLNAFDSAFKKASYMDSYDRQAAQDQGAGIGNLINIGTGAAAGFMTGGMPGAIAGGLGGMTGASGVGDLIDVFSKKPAAITQNVAAGPLPGVSKLGAIDASGSGALDGFYKKFPYLAN